MESVGTVLGKRKRQLLDELLEAGIARFPGLLCCLDSGGVFLVCSRKDLHNHPPIGMINRVRLIISEDGSYNLQVIFCSKEKGIVSNVEDFVGPCEKIGPKSSYVTRFREIHHNAGWGQKNFFLPTGTLMAEDQVLRV